MLSPVTAFKNIEILTTLIQHLQLQSNLNFHSAINYALNLNLKEACLQTLYAYCDASCTL